MTRPGTDDLGGAVTVITGASRGIGRTLARELAAAGARVAAAARDRVGLDTLVEEITAAGGEAVAVPTDISDAASVDGLFDAVADRFGRVDALVNNAGIISYEPLTETDPATWDRIFAVNVRGTFLCTRAALGKLERGGSIVNIASVFGTTPVRGYGAYCASKAAILQLTRVAAAENARRGIRVNAVAPGYVESDFNAESFADPAVREAVERRIPLGRIATADELVPIVRYLCSPNSAYVTGSVVTVDGGFSLR
ncbi:SDR family oxidoreductase [Solwaraspora sp. WMMD1047]|uniref:SDR family NAD(P)-dependent oxidoreductase n=1 Tax=Solwaraspora sp. WMMD1047 TaxID=3016102 RepID=UPI002415E440|nr:SDR family oxidoreductase [Solwaraspora sp. WMMD1047]MDG4834309.1 SDR family oxidoreductase [Solwaraspora sp. WMMD1047]